MNNAEKAQRAVEFLCNQPVGSPLYEYGRDILDRLNELDAEVLRLQNSGLTSDRLVSRVECRCTTRMVGVDRGVCGNCGLQFFAK